MVSTDIIIDIQQLTHVYPNGARALNGINLQIRRGEFLGIIGQNGAGKTTLVKHFNGLLKPTSGRVVVKGVDTLTTHASKLAKFVGYVFQNPDHQIFASTVRDEIAFGPKNIGMDKATIMKNVDEAIEILDLKDVLDIHPFRLSRGQRQRLAIAGVLAMRPEIFMLDEPTGGQDREQVLRLREVLTKLNNEGHTIILITHDMELLAESTRRAIVVGNGKVILDGEPADVFKHTDELNAAFLTPPQVSRLTMALGFERPAMSVDEAVNMLLKKNKEQNIKAIHS
ncbi:MAG: energy-coupling factor ABC transporter ATP-binding protein [Chloroflexota bacterium]|jgi:cobalt transport protein ATP-binding subunit